MLRISQRFTFAALIILGTTHAQLSAQSAGDELRGAFPELAGLLDAFDVTQAAMYDQLLAITRSSESTDGQDALRESLGRAANMSMAEMMGQMHQAEMMDMAMASGPFGMLETDAMDVLRGLIQANYSPDEAGSSLSGSEALTERATAVLQRGREFEARIYDIYADEGNADKQAALDGAIEEYLSDTRNSVAAEPKDPALMYRHPFAGAMRTGFPQISGLYWASQWLQLASLEPLMTGTDVSAGMDIAIERYRSKISGMGGMSPVPTEIPMVPAISPLLLNRHPEAAWIIDNLNMLELVIADLLVHPDVADRSASIDAATASFTDRSSNILVGPMAYRDYLLSALRTGIYNQGGPALGQLARSERNRSRMEMEMGGHVSLPGMN